MTLHDNDELAAAYVLGTLSAGRRRAAAAALERDPGFAELVAAWERRLAPLATSLPPENPPDGLFKRIEGTIEAMDRGPHRELFTIRAHEGRWERVAAGVQRKLLSEDPRTGRRSLLLRLQPGAGYPSHEHPEDEECLVLEGDLRFGDLELRVGDFQLAPAGVPHPAAFSPSGCLLFISTGG